jgi:hypothetical protein
VQRVEYVVLDVRLELELESGVPNLWGVRRDKPQQAGDSGLLFTPVPKVLFN